MPPKSSTTSSTPWQVGGSCCFNLGNTCWWSNAWIQVESKTHLFFGGFQVMEASGNDVSIQQQEDLMNNMFGWAPCHKARFWCFFSLQLYGLRSWLFFHFLGSLKFLTSLAALAPDWSKKSWVGRRIFKFGGSFFPGGWGGNSAKIQCHF